MAKAYTEIIKELTAKVQFLVDHYCRNEGFTFPDGEHWGRTTPMPPPTPTPEEKRRDRP